jgi:hypothetical protein
MTRGIGSQLIKSLDVDQYEDNFDGPGGVQTYMGGFVMELSLATGEVLTSLVAPEFGVALGDGQLDTVMQALEGVTVVDVIRNQTEGTEATVAVTDTEGGKVVVISDPGPRRPPGDGLIAILSVLQTSSDTAE